MKRSARFFSPASIILLFIFHTLAFTSTLAQGADNRDLLKNLHNLRVQSYFAINAYYNFSAAQGDKALMGDINDATDSIKELIVNITDLHPEDKKVQQIQASWKTLSEQLDLNIKDILKTGYPDLRMVDNMAQQNLSFNKQIEEFEEEAKSEANIKLPEPIAKSRESAISMSLMMTKYSARSTSNVSQIFQGSMNDKSIDAIAKDFDESIAIVKKAATGDKAKEKLVSAIMTKWNFIRGSYINYNENNVNYVVNLYSRRIILALVELDDLFSTTN